MKHLQLVSSRSQEEGAAAAQQTRGIQFSQGIRDNPEAP